MKYRWSIVVASLFVFSVVTYSQRNVTPAVDRDPIMEATAKHDLDVAWQYFSPLKKAYKSVILRFEETYASYPDFSKIDEFLYLGGMSSYYLSEGKGKQKVDMKSEREKEKFASAKLKEDAVRYLTELVDKHPESKYVEEAKKTLATLQTAKK